MDLHPVIVHFPVALLSLYSVLEIIRFKNIQTKSLLVVLGTLGSYAAYITGLINKNSIVGEIPPALNWHQIFATITLVIFTIISIYYLTRSKKEWLPPFLLVILAILGLAFITLTGALGGSLVYGPDTDPFVKFIYSILPL